MTTIVGDWINKILVSDSQFTDDDSGIKYFDEKIVAIDGGYLGVAGNWSDCEKVVEYINKKLVVPIFTRDQLCKMYSCMLALIHHIAYVENRKPFSGS